MRTLVVRPLAEADIEEAHAWYAARSPRVAARFLDTLAVILAEVQRRPESFPSVYKSMRRALMPRFPFGIYFHAGAERVSVLAVVHSRRHPRRWSRRLES
jgi:plasmid stabilization system protein ParE